MPHPYWRKSGKDVNLQASGLHIRYTVNCSLLLWTDHTKILVDGIHGSAGLFSEMSEQTVQSLTDGTAPCDGIDWLIFTHGHADHFDWKQTQRFMKTHHIDGIALPPESGYTDCCLTDIEEALEGRETRFLHAPLKKWQTDTFRAGDFEVTQICVPHSGKEYHGIRNTTLMIRAGETQIYIGGDGDYADKAHRDVLAGSKIDYAFFNPFYQLFYTGRKMVESLDIGKVFIYHLPYPSDDKNGLYDKTVRAAKQYGDPKRPFSILKPGTDCISC